jgi:hypothetical protein
MTKIPASDNLNTLINQVLTFSVKATVNLTKGHEHRAYRVLSLRNQLALINIVKLVSKSV